MRPLTLALTALLLTLAACTGDAPSPSAATPEASPHTEATPTAEPSPEPTPEVPPLADLYRPTRYAPPELGIGQRLRPTRISPPTIDAANAEAQRYLGNDYPQLEDSPPFRDVPGAVDRQCFDTTTAEGWLHRSGDFVVNVRNWKLGNGYNFVVTPRSPWRMLTLRATYLDTDDTTDPPTYLHEHGQDLAPFGAWELTYTPPEEGRWLVVATAGPQWGCFVLDAPTPNEYFTPARTVAEAEADGAAYRLHIGSIHVTHRFSRDRGPGVVEEGGGWTVGGGPERVCLDTAGIHDARSGEWAIRPSSALFEQNPNADGNKFLLVPRNQTISVEELRSRADHLRLRATSTYLEAPHHTYVYEQLGPNAYTGVSRQTGDRAFEFQFIPQMVLPRYGAWMVVVTDGGVFGSQWGCFASPGHGTPYPYDDN